jgi:hypothetical protein
MLLYIYLILIKPLDESSVRFVVQNLIMHTVLMYCYPPLQNTCVDTRSASFIVKLLRIFFNDCIHFQSESRRVLLCHKQFILECCEFYNRNYSYNLRASTKIKKGHKIFLSRKNAVREYNNEIVAFIKRKVTLEPLLLVLFSLEETRVEICIPD